MMETGSVRQARVALESALFAALADECSKGGIVYHQPGTDFVAGSEGEIVIIHRMAPGKTMVGEMGGRHGIVPRPGVYTVTFSCPNDADTLARAEALCDVVERAFYRSDIPIADTNCSVMCDEPYTTNVGSVPGTTRVALSVTIPWWMWAGGPAH